MNCELCGHDLVVAEPPSEATDEEIEAARAKYADGNINIDSGAEASRGDDGTWVQAWVLVRAEDSLLLPPPPVW